MIKSLAAPAVFAFPGLSALGLPGFAPEVKANEVQTGTDALIREARLVTAHREP
jgi:hypothetical protein